MSTNGATVTGGGSLELPPFSMEVQSLDLGPDVKSVGFELIGTENREPVTGPQAAEIWTAVVLALAAGEAYTIDFFSHIVRVADFCIAHHIGFRPASGRCLVLHEPKAEQLRELFARFEAESFGVRVGALLRQPDAALEDDLSKRGLEAYRDAYARYTFCGILEAYDGWFTVLSETLWSSEAIRRIRPALQPFDVYLARPQ
jgi:hypothetical protein